MQCHVTAFLFISSPQGKLCQIKVHQTPCGYESISLKIQEEEEEQEEENKWGFVIIKNYAKRRNYGTRIEERQIPDLQIG